MNKLTFVVILINSAAVSASRHIFSLPKVFHSLISTPDDSNCADGVCEIKTNNIVSSQNLESKVLDDWSSSQNMTSDQLEDIEQKVKEISKMGWKEVEARKALALSNYDVGEACVFLEKEEDDRAVLLDQVKEIMANGWSKEAAESAAIECKGNITAALALLDSEEEAILSNFENAVQDMLSNGWEEVVARQALLAQWSLDQRKAMGKNTTTPPETLAKLRPTLKRLNETQSASKGPSKSGSGGSKGAGNDGTKPTPAKKEDCVFDVNINNFQKIVLDSPVPVLVDIYADWCGPCKQLGPVLEDAAMKSGGMFRLAKVNSDNERAIAEALEVTGLPTVFAVNAGKFTDRFVGMLPQDQMQSFLVRCITGYGSRVQEDVTESFLTDVTDKLGSMAGLASISFKKREKLYSLVEAAMALPGAYSEQGQGVMSEGVKTALLYISNAAKDVKNVKVRTIRCSSKAFVEKVAGCEAAERLLGVAGFQPKSTAATSAAVVAPTAEKAVEASESTPTIDSETTDATASIPAQPIAVVAPDLTLELAHSNGALLQLVYQRAVEVARERKFAKVKAAKVQLPVKMNTVATPLAAPATAGADNDQPAPKKSKKSSKKTSK